MFLFGGCEIEISGGGSDRDDDSCYHHHYQYTIHETARAN
jgi:hypothetical protein